MEAIKLPLSTDDIMIADQHAITDFDTDLRSLKRVSEAFEQIVPMLLAFCVEAQTHLLKESTQAILSGNATKAAVCAAQLVTYGGLVNSIRDFVISLKGGVLTPASQQEK